MQLLSHYEHYIEINQENVYIDAMTPKMCSAEYTTHCNLEVPRIDFVIAEASISVR